MRYKGFLRSFDAIRARSPVDPLRPGAAYAIVQDLRMGDGSRLDELRPSAEVAEAVFGAWFDEGRVLVLGGDTEDLRGFWRKDIAAAWRPLTTIIQAFAAKGRLRRILGERDLGLVRRGDLPYPLHHGLRIEGEGVRVFVLHGHQASRFFAGRDYLEFVEDFRGRARKIGDEADLEKPDRVHRAELRLHRASLERGLVTIAGHTGRVLFGGKGAFEDLRAHIDALLRDRPEGEGKGELLSELVELYRGELRRESRRGRQPVPELETASPGALAPCLFNPGRAAERRGLSAIEIDGLDIRLVHRAQAGEVRSSLERRALRRERLPGGALRLVLAEVSLPELRERIDLLSPWAGAPAGVPEELIES